MTGRVFAVKGRSWTNWARTATATPDTIFYARSVAELQAIVTRAQACGKRVRVVGAGYSWSPMASTEGYLIDVSALRGIQIDRQQRLVHVEPGATIGQLSKAVAASNLFFASTAVIDRISVGGAVAMGVHGTGWACQTLSDAVVAMEIVLSSGEVRTFSVARDGPEVMNAVRVNLGVLGIISRVTFQLVDLFTLRAVDEKRDMVETIALIGELVTANNYVELFWFPFNRKVWIKRWNRSADPTDPPGLPGWARRLGARLNIAIGTSLLQALVAYPPATPAVERLMFGFIRSGERVASAPDVFHYQSSYMKIMDTCCALPIDSDFANVQRAWNVVVEGVGSSAAAGRYPQNMVLHARFIGGSTAWLSPAGGNQHTCMIEILTYWKTPCYQDYFQDIYQEWMALGGRPHWGKLFWDMPAVRQAYEERLDAFDHVRRRLDPGGMFLNDCLETLFATP